MRGIPEKLFFKIGEVSDIVGVKPHVLRYWETEFESLRPRKTGSGHRIYRRKDLELLLRIKELVYVEGYTIAGARRQLNQLQSGQSATSCEEKPIGPTKEDLAERLEALEKRGRETLEEMREQVQELLSIVTE